MVVYSRSSVQNNNNNRRFIIRRNKCIIKFIKNQPDIDKIYLYAKDPYESKYKGLKHFNDPKVFIEYSNDMQDVHKNIEEYNTVKECKIIILFDDMIADMINNKKLNSIVTDLFIRGRKLNTPLVFNTQLYFKVR